MCLSRPSQRKCDADRAHSLEEIRSREDRDCYHEEGVAARAAYARTD